MPSASSAGVRLTNTPKIEQALCSSADRAALTAATVSAGPAPLTTTRTGAPSSFAMSALRPKSSAGAAPTKSVPSQTTKSHCRSIRL